MIETSHQQIADDLNSSREVISRLLKNGTAQPAETPQKYDRIIIEGCCDLSHSTAIVIRAPLHK